jgi:hypothetical protein
MQRSINVALPTVIVDWLDTMETAGAAVAGGGGATNSRHIHTQEQRANIRITPPHRTSASKTGTTATLTVAMSTMGTPAGAVRTYTSSAHPACSSRTRIIGSTMMMPYYAPYPQPHPF